MPDPAPDAPAPEWNPEPLQLDQLGSVLMETLEEWARFAVTMLPNLVVAVVVFAIAWMIAGIAQRVTRRAVARFTNHQQLVYLAGIGMRLGITSVGLFAALAVLNLDGVVTSLLAGVGVVGLALGFAFQDIAANLMSGVMMAGARPFRVGDVIKTADYFGTVEQIGLRVTQIRTPTGELVLIPNKDVTNSALVNYTETSNRRVDISVGVAYGDDLAKAQEAIVAGLKTVKGCDENKPVQALFVGFGGSSIDLSCRFWINTQNHTDYMVAQSDGIKAIKRALDDAGLNIPFPIRTLDFGAKAVGGENLDRMLPSQLMRDDGEAAVAK